MQRLGRAIAISRQHRLPASKRFEIDDAKAFAFARHREHIAKIVIIGQFSRGDAAGQHHRVANVQFANQSFNSRPVFSFTDQDVSHIRNLAPDCRKSAQDLVVAFVTFGLSQSGHRQHNFVSHSEVVPAHEVSRFRARLQAFRIDGVWQNDHLLRLERLLFQKPLSRVIADRQDEIGMH